MKLYLRNRKKMILCGLLLLLLILMRPMHYAMNNALFSGTLLPDYVIILYIAFMT